MLAVKKLYYTYIQINLRMELIEQFSENKIFFVMMEAD